jgi:Lon protease-like protein
MRLPEVIPLFPLPNVVFFPRIPLPLHVFEPRYRAMVQDALRGARLIGMVLLRGDWQEDYYGRPPVFGTGTVGQIVHVEELVDGRFNLVLRGLREFEIAEELPARADYREARVRWREVDEALTPDARAALLDRVERHLARLGKGLAPAVLEHDGAALVNFFAQHLDVAPLEKQALLEEPTTTGRARRLIDVLEFRLRELGTPGGSPYGRPQ